VTAHQQVMADLVGEIVHRCRMSNDIRETEALPNTFGDRPIACAKEDRLGRKGFAQALATHLLRTPADDSAVFALYGAWGSGKTSILNLVEGELSKEGELSQNKTLTVLRFNPWLFSGTDQLVSGFFRELAAQLSERKHETFQKVAEIFAGMGEVFSVVSAVPGVGGWAKVAEVAAKGASMAAAYQGNAFKSLESQRKRLIDALQKIEGRVIVLIDDIDRLRHEEIRDIVRLVRLVADLPRTVYLLAFDRVRVVQALSESGQSGQDYLKKNRPGGSDGAGSSPC
jgi:predicted KAP-like P-loop ATPase